MADKDLQIVVLSLAVGTLIAAVIAYISLTSVPDVLDSRLGIPIHTVDVNEEFQRAMAESNARTDQMRRERAAQRAEDDRKRFLESLMCAYSEDNDTCSCIDPKGVRPPMNFDQCKELAQRGMHQWAQ